ncbi:hypothetical protein E3J38_02095 [candidate division TA06 bacterium]|uniref:Uncharacterized protein n=1 Tax=candidate division TA06 bacterium TaxID=2250710 RepID=A0A523XT63_UNCT6|nr:MAG: hypothetical protein E3J38_02095 [candidate division TA06 bacterium]
MKSGMDITVTKPREDITVAPRKNPSNSAQGIDNTRVVDRQLLRRTLALGKRGLAERSAISLSDVLV